VRTRESPATPAKASDPAELLERSAPPEWSDSTPAARHRRETTQRTRTLRNAQSSGATRRCPKALGKIGNFNSAHRHDVELVFDRRRPLVVVEENVECVEREVPGAFRLTGVDCAEQQTANVLRSFVFKESAAS
jgi:hypothetical protein